MSTNNTYFSLASLKASAVAEGTAFLIQVTGVNDGMFFWTPGDFTSQDDDENILESDHVALNLGAWVRQASRTMTFTPESSGTPLRTTESKLRETVSVLDFEADPTGVSDSTAAFEAAIAMNKTVFVPAGTYLLNITIDQSDVEIVGDNYRQTLLKPFTAAEPVITIDGDAAGVIIEKFSIRNLSIEGADRAGHGISVVNTSDTTGCDFLNFEDLFIGYCNYGIHVAGRSIWNSFKNVRCLFNIDGWHIETDQACNAWTISGCQAQKNKRHGLFVKNTGEDTVFINWTFEGFNSEDSGQDTSVDFSCGVYLENVQCFDFTNCYIENNGLNILSSEGYGFLVTGDYGRFVNIENCWVVGSKYPIVYNGLRKSGRVRDILAIPSHGATNAVIIDSAGVPLQPKVEVDALSIQGGNVVYTLDVNGNYGARAVDWVGVPGTSLNFGQVDALTVRSVDGPVSIDTIDGLQPGRIVTIANYGANVITIDAALTVSGTAIAITGNAAKSLLVQGYPSAGKLYEIA